MPRKLLYLNAYRAEMLLNHVFIVSLKSIALKHMFLQKASRSFEYESLTVVDALAEFLRWDCQ